MSIRRKFVGGYLAIAVYVALIGFMSWRVEVASARHASVSEAVHVAEMIGHDVGEDRDTGQPLYQRPAELADYIADLHEQQDRDVVVVDRDRRVLGDAVPADVGSVFVEDPGDEVGAAVRTGATSTFIEHSADSPSGIRQVVVPLRTAANLIVGAVVLEYTPLYDEVMARTADARRDILLSSTAGVVLVLVLGIALAEVIVRRIGALTVAVGAVRDGEYSRRVDTRGRDELTALGRTFNTMAEELERSAREILAKEVTDRILASAGEGICGVGADGRITFANEAVGRITGTPASDLLGRDAAQLLPATDVPLDTGTGDGLPWEGMLTRPDGSVVQISCTVSPIRRGDLQAGSVVMLRDVTRQRALEQDLRHQALHDRLTGLPNRVHFEEALTHTVGRARRAGEAIAVLFVGVDGFKRVNDSLGHHVGDQLLREVSDRLCDMVRAGDTVARFGGDEFAVLLAPADDETAVAVVQRLLPALARPIPLNDRNVTITASVGIVLGVHNTADPHEVLRNADVAMDAAKRRGGNCFEIFEAHMHEELLQRLDLEYRLRDAIRDNELVLHYQPIVDVRTSRVRGVEALVRWPDETGRLRPPLTFIPLAEETGLIVDLDWWVLTEACTTILRWHRDAPDHAPAYVSVNMSAATLQLPDVADRVAAVLRTTGLTPSALLLEITETTLMTDMALISQKLQQLRAIGARIALDDFGTGYSSLGYLRDIPADTVKLDRSFIARLGDDTRDHALVHAVTQLGHALGLTVLAEGVETQIQLAELVDLGCDLAQGYHLGRPQPEGELLTLLDIRPAVTA
jgi:diguanylate cyclase (GGDEF)-like protein/PAS domain S-box-containing protein